jgi:hypothetical protein
VFVVVVVDECWDWLMGIVRGMDMVSVRIVDDVWDDDEGDDIVVGVITTRQ